MPRHIHEYITPLVAAQPLTSRHVLAQSVSEQPDEVLHRDFVAAVIHLDVIAVEIECAIRVIVDGARERVARVAGHVVGEHENNLRVRNAEAFHGAVEGEDIGKVPVIEPEAGGGDQYSPIGSMF